MQPVAQTSDKDLELWRKWKQSKSSMDLEALMKQMYPLISRESSRWTNIMPRFVVEADAKKLALEAFNSFDPAYGVKLSTHVVNRLQKLSRAAYARQSIVSVPEHKRLAYNRYKRITAQLEDELGRPPTIEDIADKMALPPPKLRSLITEVEKAEFLESEEHPPTESNLSEEELIAFAFHDMSPVQQTIFRHKTGYQGAQIKNNAALTKELGMTQGQLSYELTKIKSILKSAIERKAKRL